MFVVFLFSFSKTYLYGSRKCLSFWGLSNSNFVNLCRERKTKRTKMTQITIMLAKLVKSLRFMVFLPIYYFICVSTKFSRIPNTTTTNRNCSISEQLTRAAVSVSFQLSHAYILAHTHTYAPCLRHEMETKRAPHRCLHTGIRTWRAGFKCYSVLLKIWLYLDKKKKYIDINTGFG